LLPAVFAKNRQKRITGFFIRWRWIKQGKP